MPLFPYILSCLFLTISLTVFGQSPAFDQWQEASKTDKRLLPKYGGLEKTETEREADAEFISDIIKTFSDRMKLEVVWTDPCTYVLRPIEYLTNTDNKNLPDLIVTCRVIEVTNKGYVQVSTSNWSDLELEGEVIRIE